MCVFRLWLQLASSFCFWFCVGVLFGAGCGLHALLSVVVAFVGSVVGFGMAFFKWMASDSCSWFSRVRSAFSRSLLVVVLGCILVCLDSDSIFLLLVVPSCIIFLLMSAAGLLILACWWALACFVFVVGGVRLVMVDGYWNPEYEKQINSLAVRI